MATEGMIIEVLPGSERPVVVKTATTDLAKEALEREAARLRRARHPGVVEVLSATANRVELAWVGAHTLETARLAVPAAAAVLASVAETVADLHGMGLIHGRLDPSHVVLSGDGRPVLCGMVGPDPNDTTIGPADDVAGLGRLIDHLLGPDAEPEPIPERRWKRRNWTGYHRRTLQTLGDRASHPDPARRPTARALAQAIVEAVPDARLIADPRSAREATGAETGHEAPERFTAGTTGARDTGAPGAGLPRETAGGAGGVLLPRRRATSVAGRGPDVPHVDSDAETTGQEPSPGSHQAGDRRGPDHLSDDGEAAAERRTSFEPGTAPHGTPNDPVGEPIAVAELADAVPGRDTPVEVEPSEPSTEPPRLPPGPPEVERILGLRVENDSGEEVAPEAVQDGAVPRPPAATRSRRVPARLTGAVAAALVVVALARVGAGPGGAQEPPPAGPDDDPTMHRASESVATRPLNSWAAVETSEAGEQTGEGASGQTGRFEPEPSSGSDPEADPEPGSRTHLLDRAGVTYAVGEPGDRVSVADWDCDGVPTPAVVRPPTGEVFVFDGWAAAGQPVVETADVVVPGAESLAPRADGPGCGAVLHLADGATVTLVATSGTAGTTWAVDRVPR